MKMNTGSELTPGQTPAQTLRRSSEAGFCGCNSLFCALFLIAFGAFFLLGNLDVFPSGFYLCGVNERSIDVQVTRLRRKIEPDPKVPRYLQTVWGEGYVLLPDQG